MLERQHTQLIAGLQELYWRMQNDGGWTGPRLEVGINNQPLTHKILEALGVLQSDEWEDIENVNHNWQGLENQEQNEWGWSYPETGLPSTQAALSQPSITQAAFQQSTIMSKRRSKAQSGLAPTAQTLSMPPPFMASITCLEPEIYSHALLTQIPTPADTLPPNEQMSMDFSQGSDSMVDWSFGMDDLFGNLVGQEQSAKGS